ncbi:hypothetical protein LCGC14_2324970, partial [marine sediment metagenome]
MPDAKEDMTPAVSAQYVNSLLEELKNETR